PMLQNLAEAVEQLRYDMDTALRYRRRGERQFDVSFKGVSDEAGLGGTSGKGGPGIVYAWPQTASDEAVYLFGNAWDHFDGHGWSSTLKPETTELLNCRLDTAEHVYALWRLLSAEDVDAGFDDYFRSNSVYLSYYNMNVRTMFQVMNMTHIETDEDRFPYSDAPTGSMFDYVQQNETWYSVSYLEPNSRTLDVLIAASEGTAYNEDAGGPF
ncbi:MAG: hypothetical protein J5449_10465, partial [Oscillospiraceae bacterium]|nr:hypothetical protein [Oscillospiraceae bacterium]